MLATVQKAGLIGRVSWNDDLLCVSMPVHRLVRASCPAPPDPPERGLAPARCGGRRRTGPVDFAAAAEQTRGRRTSEGGGMSARETVAVVGAGLAAAHAVEALRAGGYDGHRSLFGAEPHRPYERPPLSKGYLLGNDEREPPSRTPAAWYDEHDVDLRLGTTVTALDPTAKVVLTGDPERFDRLLVAPGRRRGGWPWRTGAGRRSPTSAPSRTASGCATACAPARGS